MREKSFASKSKAIDYIIATGKFSNSVDILNKLKVIRYPYKEEELRLLRFEEIDKILTELLNELNLTTHNTTSEQRSTDDENMGL